MRVTVCELPNARDAFPSAWRALSEHTRAERSELLLLPEMPFTVWLPATDRVDAAAWAVASAVHERFVPRLAETGVATVVTTFPVVDGGHRFNESCVWERGVRTAVRHRKSYLPEEPGFHEASWYDRGDGRFELHEIHGRPAGFLVCSELWFQEHARAMGRAGAEILFTPRATHAGSVEKWIAGGRVAAAVSGAWSLSSNFSGEASDGAAWGGAGWIVEPEEGELVARTSASEPFVTREIDLGAARAAKTSYPRYVEELGAELDEEAP